MASPKTSKKKTVGKSAAATTAAAAKAEFRAVARGIRVHVHPLPRCRGGKHDAACAGKGSEVNCASVVRDGVGVCICTHFRL